MLLKLQILFTILSAVCVAAVIPVGTFFDWVWAIACALGAFMFFMLMKLCKQSRENNESNAASERPEDVTKTDRNEPDNG